MEWRKNLRSIELAKPPRLRMPELADSAGLAPICRTESSQANNQTLYRPSLRSLTTFANICWHPGCLSLSPLIFQWQQPLRLQKPWNFADLVAPFLLPTLTATPRQQHLLACQHRTACSTSFNKATRQGHLYWLWNMTTSNINFYEK